MKNDPLLENLSPRVIKEIAENIKYQRALSEDAFRLMLLFCDLVDNKKPIPKELKDHFRDAFKKIAALELSADRALGIKRINNRPRLNDDVGLEIASEVLMNRLKGKNFHLSVEIVADSKEIGKTKVKNIWKLFKEQALDLEIMYRYEKGLIFSESEKKTLNKSYKLRNL
jgi:signal transduction histidine kinase